MRDWSGRRDLNPRPLDPQSSALPDCATPRYSSLQRIMLTLSRLFFTASLLLRSPFAQALQEIRSEHLSRLRVWVLLVSRGSSQSSALPDCATPRYSSLQRIMLTLSRLFFTASLLLRSPFAQALQEIRSEHLSRLRVWVLLVSRGSSQSSALPDCATPRKKLQCERTRILTIRGDIQK